MNNKKPMETKKKVIIATVLIVALIADYFIISAVVRVVQFIGDYFEKLFEPPVYTEVEPYEREDVTSSFEEESKKLEELIGKP